ncbi:uncharacterized protein LOC128553748 [Mercenaria mercenaria]|uniref:uncharacterized protein LOC128553748 n=1 Tax=Mercenaria mercenaria TaxID=6596 RepID=UPI00234F0E60|nr:uncharacterized protein LOC128553748 [Mercenaria mercenaria]
MQIYVFTFAMRKSKTLKKLLFLSCFLTFLVCGFMLYTKKDSEIKQISPNFTVYIPPNSTAMFLPNHLNKSHRIGVLIMCNYQDNRGSLSLMTLLQQNIPSIYRTMENGHIYKIYVGLTESFRDIISSQYNKLLVMSLDNRRFSDGINSLAKKAVSDQIEYFALAGYDTEFNLNTWTSQAIYSLKGHCPSDIGVVLQHCCNTNAIAMVHKRHFNLFGNFLPPKLNITDSIAWLQRMYFSDHLSTLPVNTEPYSTNLLKRAIHESERKKTSLNNNLENEKELCVISYSLYGSDHRYIGGAVENSYLLTIIYPGWNIWIYHDNSVPKSILDTICKLRSIKCINMSLNAIKNKRSWRFLVASERKVARFIIRDIDSRLSFREKVAVNEWIYSGRKLHTMRDHPHQTFFINAGLWGGMNDTYQNMEQALYANHLADNYLSDSNFLNRIVWPAVKHSVMKHDSVLGLKFGGVNFPTSRIGYEHVGSVYINGKERKVDVDSLRRFKILNN